MLSHLSHVQLFVTLWTIAHQAPLSMGFSRQEYWTQFPFPSPGDLPDTGIKPAVSDSKIIKASSINFFFFAFIFLIYRVLILTKFSDGHLQSNCFLLTMRSKQPTVFWFRLFYLPFLLQLRIFSTSDQPKSCLTQGLHLR